MFEYTYMTKGTCSKVINITLDGDVVKDITFIGGCQGNLKAIPKLCEGMTVDEVSRRLTGIDCGGKGTSCGDQLARGLQEAYAASQA